MRQLRATGWMHNRVRMVVASFLVKDLHIAWQRGAEHFMAWLVDGDVPQNQLNWQWVAGTGRDAAPYFRVFNPVLQGEKFDPDGDVRAAVGARAARRPRPGRAPAVAARARSAARLPRSASSTTPSSATVALEAYARRP